MTKQLIEQLITAAIENLQHAGKLPEQNFNFQVDETKDKQHGDFATNAAMMLAKAAKQKPRDLAELILQELPQSRSIAKVEIAGPGFINFFLTADALQSVIPEILRAGEKYGENNLGENKKVLVEFVSSNPTGPLHVGHGRHAAYGAVVANLLQASGYKVHREYYVNDAGRQMDIIAVSVWLRYLALKNPKLSFPVNAYKGEYVIDIALKLEKKIGDKYIVPEDQLLNQLPLDETDGGDKEAYIDAIIVRAKKILGNDNYHALFTFTLTNILDDIRNDLAEYGVEFESWFSEYDFTRSDVVDKMIADLESKGLVYEREGAIWFRSTDFNDEKDRVLQRSNGQRTYFANDLAYHVNKFERGFDLVIDIFGSDHHGYLPRMQAGLQAFNISLEKYVTLFLQFVSLYRKGEQVPMSTRTGSFVPLRELRSEVGNDAARFFYVMRKAEQHVDFDLDLAKSQTNENPVFYVQYAYARICSVFRQLAEKRLDYGQEVGLNNLMVLTQPHELQLIMSLARYPTIIINATKQYEPHILTQYLRELANDFHSYYNAHQFLVEDEKLRNARLLLVIATRQVLVNGLKLLGVSTPETM